MRTTAPCIGGKRKYQRLGRRERVWKSWHHEANTGQYGQDGVVNDRVPGKLFIDQAFNLAWHSRPLGPARNVVLSPETNPLHVDGIREQLWRTRNGVHTDKKVPGLDS